uniref:Molybdopterin biosynthesis protein n=1 Tax=Trichogloeopsis pedicellata TaxID=1495610 RepID=A0A1G4P0R8_9FLOR|nr:Molybdopterin biosynthesis protein [Trichogloeopsis pedicellata]SCW24490.1 Molybdopterin biosynthesis protein [Trichogloeopsis pedicellata]
MNQVQQILTEEEYEIYAKHIIIPEIQTQGQQRLKHGRVLSIGAGGLASASLLYLVSNGIGQLGIIDDDTIEKSNLHRQILFRTKDIGKLKTESAQHNLYELNASCQLKIFSTKLSKSNAYTIIKQYDLILDNTDNFETRWLISQLCYQLHKIHIYGAISTFTGQVSVFNYQGGPNYHDLNTKNHIANNNICNTAGVLGILPGIIGLLQATEIIKILTGIGNILNGQILIYNLLTNTFKKSFLRHITKPNDTLQKIKADDKSKQYLKIKPYLKNVISLSRFNQLVKTKKKIYLVDIRDQIEYETGHFLKAINIPLAKLQIPINQKILIQQSFNHTIVIYCNSFSRSKLASLLLINKYINHFILQTHY